MVQDFWCSFIQPALAVQPRRSVFGEFRVFALAVSSVSTDASEDRFKLGLLSSRTKGLESLPLADTAGIGWPKLLLELGFERN